MSETVNNRTSVGSTSGVDTAGIREEQHGCLQSLRDMASSVGRVVKGFFARIGSLFSRLSGRVRNSNPVRRSSLKQRGEQRYAEVVGGLDLGKAKAGAWRENVTAWKEAGGPDPEDKDPAVADRFSFNKLARDDRTVVDGIADYGNQPWHSFPALRRLYSDCSVIARLDVKIEAYPEDSRVSRWKNERADLQQDVDTIVANGYVSSDHENRRVPV